MKKLLSLLLVLVLCFSLSAAAADGFNVIVDSKTANAGETVEVNVSFENNSGLIAALFNVEYDRERLQLVEVRDGKLLEGATFSPDYEAYPYKMVWNSASPVDFTDDGVLVTLSFKVEDSAKPGDAFIRLTYNGNDVFDVELNNVGINVINGNISVINDEQESGSDTQSGSSGNVSTSGGGGAAQTTDRPENSNASAGRDETSGQGNGAPSTESETVSGVSFTDLGNHTWARDAINTLAEAGIVKGTTENTYSPAANITRADFAILLVRAFELESENTENFADVLPTDYFADELAIARNTGIVNGIGDNKYAPRSTITRQDMMVIVYRALTTLEKIHVGDDALIVPDYPDFDSVADYAQDAARALITSGLVNGKSGKIAPTDYTTRAEVAVLLKRLLEYTK